jgi:predicted phosphodiesterase
MKHLPDDPGTASLPARIAVIADVHDDLVALGSVLAAIDRSRVDATWCLGDIVGLGATDPAGVVDLVRRRSAVVLAGSHDRWVTGLWASSRPRGRA